MRRFKFPTINSSSLGPYIKAGLVVEASDASGIVFQIEWGTKQFNAFLRRLFPKLFDYFDTLSPVFKDIPDEPDTAGMKRIAYSLPYVLLQKEYRKYTIVDETHPVGAKYKEFLSGDGSNSGFRTKSIFIGEYPSLTLLYRLSKNGDSLFTPSDQSTSSPSAPRPVVFPIPCPGCPHQSCCYHRRETT